MEIYLIDERAKTTRFHYNNYESARFNMITTIMLEVLKVANIWDARIRKKVDEQIKEQSHHLVWSMKERNVHVLTRVA